MSYSTYFGKYQSPREEKMTPEDDSSEAFSDPSIKLSSIFKTPKEPFA